LGRRDLIQNIAKVETAVHQYMESSHHSNSPSLQELLEHEVTQKTHSSLPKLSNESAAMGLLWAKRQVDYQACVYANLVEGNFKDSHASVKAAYKQVFDPYHGWWIQQMFSQSFRSAPPAHEVYKLMVKDVAVTTTVATEESSVPYWAESSCSSFDDSNISFSSCDGGSDVDTSYYHHDDLLQDSPVECQFLGGNFWDKATKHIQFEWDKFAESTAAFFQGRPQRLTTHAVQQHESRSNLQQVDRRSAFAAMKPSHDPIKTTAHEHIQGFLKTTKPMIHDISTLLDTLNMNDPTKV